MEGLITTPAEGSSREIIAVFSHLNLRANGRLMAAAPDLLDCCLSMLDLHNTGSWGSPPGEYLPAIRAAVAKATTTPGERV